MRTVHRLILLVLTAGCIYLGWTFYSRWNQNRIFINALKEKKTAQEQAIIDATGGGRLTIINFYATPPTIRRGEASQICYGVSNAKNVHIVPAVKYVWPSLSRCVEVAPDKDTVYRLVAEDAAGNTAAANTTVKVE
jgi:NAD-dependent oxidoreductase involved in siderophore biosynthesis